MVALVFYELPECPANQKQKAQLTAAGHSLDLRDIRQETWTADRLLGFFGDSPVESWFNRTHPDIRSKAIDRTALTADQALTLLTSRPDLIRRPLMETADEKFFGFDPAQLDAQIGLKPLVDESCDTKHAAGRCDHGHHHFPKR